MALPHIFLAILVAFIWGTNFVAIDILLGDLPPIFATALRFFVAAFPAIFFLKRPQVPLRTIGTFGLFMFAGHFGFLFAAMYAGLSPGLASLILQVHVFITIALATLFLGERPAFFQIAGAALAFSGVALVATQRGGDVTSLGLILVLCAAVSWGIGNLIARQIGSAGSLSLIIWGSAATLPPLVATSLALEGTAQIAASFAQLSLSGILALGYIVYISTWVGFTIWSFLLGKYPTAVVTPFALLVPVFGLFSSAALLGEALQPWKFAAAILVLGGLALNVFGPRIIARRASA